MGCSSGDETSGSFRFVHGDYFAEPIGLIP
jgi:hypothetical protein